ncbi:hypothetical protein [Streptomyces sp. NPDC006333]|uniref:hypothetical protein n=1 Tax=Streptomyces sp. NPDC006333 TaxID=3156753 RepID=UPI0033B23BC7
MSERTVRVDALPESVVALLHAVYDALDIPLPGLTDADEREHAALLQRRCGNSLTILGCVLDDKHDIAPAAATLRRWTAEQPVTYTPWAGDGSAA